MIAALSGTLDARTLVKGVTPMLAFMRAQHSTRFRDRHLWLDRGVGRLYSPGWPRRRDRF